MTGAVTSSGTSSAPRTGVLRVRSGRVSMRVHVRSAVVGVVLLAAVAAAGVLFLGVGEIQVAPLDVVRTLLGNGSELTDLAVLELRLPRLLTGMLVGAALGLSGAIFQSITRNPLGSPDIIGFTYGSATGALVVITVLGGDPPAVATGAVLGGLATAATVYLLAWKRGVRGYLLVLIGIGVSAILQSVNFYLMVNAELADVARATVWLTGSLQNRGWSHALPVAVALAVLVPATLLAGGTLRLLEMGDETATSLGVGVQRSRLYLLILGTAACGVATAAAGPVAFVALTAPQLARRLTRASGPNLVPALLMGALVVVLADFASQHLTADNELPAGVTTAGVGGVYLCWLLWRQHRSGRSAT